jgi:ornithine cyclodeaminase/alanine dehydrogenase-like protein (mu-crystallin family)
MKDVIDAVEEGFRALARGEVNVPDRLRLDVPDQNGIVLEMPAYIGSSGGEQSALGTKIVSVFERNPSRGLDIIQSAYLLLDSETGAPLSLMDGRFITAIRTAATSAVATKYMASPGPKRLAVFGGGVQARFHLDAMMEVVQIARVMIVSRNADKARALADLVRESHKLPCEVVSAEEAAANANLICTCTSSQAELFDGRLLAPGTHINAVGAFTPSTRELDSETVRRARVILDAESAAGREAGEILIPIAEGVINHEHVKGMLADVVSGKVAGRESLDEITLFKSCGHAVEDMVTARLAHKRAQKLQRGTNITL